MGDELAAENRASEVKAGGRNLPRKDAPERGSREQVAPQLIPCRSKTAATTHPCAGERLNTQSQPSAFHRASIRIGTHAESIGDDS
jgi:hypothetical protein